MLQRAQAVRTQGRPEGALSSLVGARSRAWLASPLAWLGLTAALLLLALWLERDALPDLARSFSQADPPLVLLTLVLLVSVEVVKAFRWQALFGQQRPTFTRVLQATVVGQAANTVVPIRLGELLRLSWADPTTGGVARGAASLLLAKGLDAVMLAFVVVWAFGGAWLHQPLAVAAAVGLLGAALLAVVARRAALASLTLPGHAGRLLAWGLAYARELRPSTAALAVLSTGLAWGLGGAANATTLAALGVTPTLDLALRILASGYLAGLAPAPPGRVGVYEAAVVAALLSGGLALPTAIVVAIGLHALQLLEIVLLAPLATRWR